MLILAGDIGGTTTRLAFFRPVESRLDTVAFGTFASGEADSLAAMVRQFVAAEGLTAERACFGVAGPVRAGRAAPPNLPWTVDAGALAALLGLAQVELINDLQANAFGLPLLAPGDLEELNPGRPEPEGTIAVIAPGTGLGATLAVWDGAWHRPLPGEWGHADFAARTPLEAALLLYLRSEHGHVSCERVLSGPGLLNLYRFLRDDRGVGGDATVAAELAAGAPPALITRAALQERCPLCSQALDLFVTLLGAETGNLALRALATGGVYLGGGIVPHLRTRLRGPAFLEAFTAKGRLRPLLETIPVRLICNELTALLGAARYAWLVPDRG